eukprot:NODE_829_length_1426_cov_65.378359_g687_i0.p1 GENE.NODE_829_length_1426_cov_65.378359_g687_i0~~NODE_829_length_1426_cov_65.378359_g687_i0.p1  ORF type:complete len:169 (-),score=42.42 NODE_829_length_1426_cov_65.378359_g687_i0:72-578(-)
MQREYVDTYTNNRGQLVASPSLGRLEFALMEAQGHLDASNALPMPPEWAVSTPATPLPSCSATPSVFHWAAETSQLSPRLPSKGGSLLEQVGCSSPQLELSPRSPRRHNAPSDFDEALLRRQRLAREEGGQSEESVPQVLSEDEDEFFTVQPLYPKATDPTPFHRVVV